MRLAHTLGVALLIVFALIGYGVKEETRALQAELDALDGERTRLLGAIVTLETEWRHLNSPMALTRLARRFYHDAGFVGVDGTPLVRIAPTHVVDLGAARPGAAFETLESDQLDGDAPAPAPYAPAPAFSLGPSSEATLATSAIPNGGADPHVAGRWSATEAWGSSGEAAPAPR